MPLLAGCQALLWGCGPASSSISGLQLLPSAPPALLRCVGSSCTPRCFPGCFHPPFVLLTQAQTSPAAPSFPRWMSIMVMPDHFCIFPFLYLCMLYTDFWSSVAYYCIPSWFSQCFSPPYSKAPILPWFSLGTKAEKQLLETHFHQETRVPPEGGGFRRGLNLGGGSCITTCAFNWCFFR